MRPPGRSVWTLINAILVLAAASDGRPLLAQSPWLSESPQSAITVKIAQPNPPHNIKPSEAKTDLGRLFSPPQPNPFGNGDFRSDDLPLAFEMGNRIELPPNASRRQQDPDEHALNRRSGEVFERSDTARTTTGGPNGIARVRSLARIQTPSTANSFASVEDGEIAAITDEDATYPSITRGHTLGTVSRGLEGMNADQRLEPGYRPDKKATRRNVITSFGNGLTWQTTDDYFALTFHNLSQFDVRLFNPTGDPLVNNFVIPRQRWYFEGHVSRYVNYYTVINRGYDRLDILDSFVDFDFDGQPMTKNAGRDGSSRFELRMGRMKVPYTYEYIEMAENDLIAGERSVFVGNMAGNRQLGIMAHGRLLDNQLHYAVGLFNGARRSFQDFNNGKDLYAYLNTRPFLNTNVEPLRQLNLGGSFNFGHEHNPLQPILLQTANDQTAGNQAASVSPTFLTFNAADIENGLRMQWSADLTYYYRSLGVMSGYQGGFQDYSTSATSPLRTRVPQSGYEVTFFYFLTGEEITARRFLLEPRNSLGRIDGVRGDEPERGFGAIELFSRFATMHLGGDVLSSGLATATSANNANVTDIGFNWYWTHYVKLTFDWQYSDYNRPVALTPHSTTTFNNLFWFRTQIFF